jgi:hypothetical protein
VKCLSSESAHASSTAVRVQSTHRKTQTKYREPTDYGARVGLIDGWTISESQPQAKPPSIEKGGGADMHRAARRWLFRKTRPVSLAR